MVTILRRNCLQNRKHWRKEKRKTATKGIRKKLLFILPFSKLYNLNFPTGMNHEKEYQFRISIQFLLHFIHLIASLHLLFSSFPCVLSITTCKDDVISVDDSGSRASGCHFNNLHILKLYCDRTLHNYICASVRECTHAVKTIWFSSMRVIVTKIWDADFRGSRQTVSGLYFNNGPVFIECHCSRLKSTDTMRVHKNSTHAEPQFATSIRITFNYESPTTVNFIPNILILKQITRRQNKQICIVNERLNLRPNWFCVYLYCISKPYYMQITFHYWIRDRKDMAKLADGCLFGMCVRLCYPMNKRRGRKTISMRCALSVWVRYRPKSTKTTMMAMRTG